MTEMSRLDRALWVAEEWRGSEYVPEGSAEWAVVVLADELARLQGSLSVVESRLVTEWQERTDG